MIEATVICLPPGAGKTRRVWEDMLKRESRKRFIWKRRISRTLILTPNRHVHRIWIRELAEVALTCKMLELPSGQLDAKTSYKKIEKFLREQCALPQLNTFAHLQSSSRSKKNYDYLIVDEWHRLPKYVVEKCDSWCKDPNLKSWFLGGRHIKKSIYFVSATPVNPVLEDEVFGDRVIDRPISEQECKEKVIAAVSRAVGVVTAITGRKTKPSKNGFFECLQDLDIRVMKATAKCGKNLQWKYPSRLAHPSINTPHSQNKGLLEFLTDLKQSETSGSANVRQNSWTIEYAWATGLVCTKFDRGSKKHYLNPKGKNGKCFGLPYEYLFVHRHSRRRAANWLFHEHPRANYLFEILKSRNLIKGDKHHYEWSGTSKAVIFCVHQAVAMGLTQVLRQQIIGADGARLQNAVKTYVRCGDPDVLIDEFNDPDSELRILIATDALSESYNLHQACKTIIHYELPWSPLRLLQRVGRLTRIKQSSTGKVRFNADVRVGHVIIPASVEEERINRLVRRIKILEEQELWPMDASWKKVTRGLLGSGPSLHLELLLSGKPS